MKAYIEHLLGGETNAVAGRNLVREYLQARMLESLQRAGAMVYLAFHGGTALRLLYAIPRYSEDLDFSLVGSRTSWDFADHLLAIQHQFTKEGYMVNIKLNAKKAVNSAFVRFNDLLNEFGLSAHSDSVLAIKIEVDTNPPAGAGLDISLIRRHVTLRLQHHDRASLLAGKLHAIFQRRFVKGRDLYDLMWYLSDPGWPEPNIDLLQNALIQTGWNGLLPDENNWRDIIMRRLMNIDWNKVIVDVKPFLEQSADVELLTLENFKILMSRSLNRVNGRSSK